ncbi:MAG: STAS domain-containing protein [Methylococcaceae bacterium]|jgi:anti-anti-sigma factor
MARNKKNLTVEPEPSEVLSDGQAAEIDDMEFSEGFMAEAFDDEESSLEQFSSSLLDDIEDEDGITAELMDQLDFPEVGSNELSTEQTIEAYADGLGQMETELEVAPLIDLPAVLNIQHVREFHEQLKKALDANPYIELNAAEVTSIDASTLQLLVALKQMTEKQGKALLLTEPSGRFIESVKLLGLSEFFELVD